MGIGGTANGNNDALGGDLLAGLHQANAVRPGQLGTRLQDLDACSLQPLAVKAFEARNFPVLGGNQRWPVEPAFSHSPAVASGIFEMLVELRRIDEQLLRHASPDDAGPAKPVLFRDRNLLPERCRDPRTAHPAGATTDDEEVIVELAHGGSPARSGSACNCA